MKNRSQKEKRLLVANWKMNPISLDQAEKIFHKIAKKTKSLRSTKVIICPPFLFIPPLTRGLPTHISLGSQNCFWEKEGAYTGEVSPVMLKKAGCRYVILGHSERRKYFGETEEIIKEKLQGALKAGLAPILCIGETIEQRKEGKTQRVLAFQLRSSALLNAQNNKLVLAYEPRWAIGTGETPDPAQAGQIARFIKEKTGDTTFLLYGGSVDSKNAVSFIEQGFDGLLVGGASLDAEEFAKIGGVIENG